MIKTVFSVLVLLNLIPASAKKNMPAWPQSTVPITLNSSKALINNDSVQTYLTTINKAHLLEKMPPVAFQPAGFNQWDNITINPAAKYQSIDGFGFCLTDGSADLISGMPTQDKAALLHELFGHDSNSIGISYLRISIGASDLSDSVYSYDDRPEGQTDKDLTHFSITQAKVHLIPLLKEILLINPDIKILGSPWSPPLWMKSNADSKGGSLLTVYYSSYAAYFVRYIQEMKKEGIRIEAITAQNEPLNPENNPSMFMSAVEQRDFIKKALGPAFKAAGITTKILIYDHNADRPDYPITVLGDPQAAAFIDGSAFHLYAGQISALSKVHDQFPEKNIYFTEQYTPSSGSFGGDLQWHIAHLIVGATRNWSRNVLEWNLAADPDLAPHTPGGCTTCLGALTINRKVISRNPSYYIIAHASKFVPSGSIRIGSNVIAGLANVAFITPNGKNVCIAVNTTGQNRSFNLQFNNKLAPITLSGGAVATFVW